MCCYSFTYSYHFDFRKKMGFTCIFENDGEKSRKNWLENEFCISYFDGSDENAYNKTKELKRQRQK